MQKRKYWTLSIITIIMIIILSTSLAFAGESSIEFKDGTVIKGEIQNKTLTIKMSAGTLKPEVDKIVFISEGTVELRDGSKIMGDVVVDEKEGLVVKTKYGTWTLHFEPEDLQMITFSK